MAIRQGTGSKNFGAFQELKIGSYEKPRALTSVQRLPHVFFGLTLDVHDSYVILVAVDSGWRGRFRMMERGGGR